MNNDKSAPGMFGMSLYMNIQRDNEIPAAINDLTSEEYWYEKETCFLLKYKNINFCKTRDIALAIAAPTMLYCNINI